MKQSAIIGTVLVAVVLAASGGFWGGMSYQKSKLPGGGKLLGTGMPQFTGDRSSGTPARRPGGVSGEVTAKDGTSLTIKLTTGSSQTVYYSDTTTVYEDAAASVADLSVGKQVTVDGTPNSDGSVTATTLRLTK